MTVRKTETDYHNLATVKGWQWLGTSVPRSHELTEWRCKHDHVISARYHDLAAADGGCRHCRKIELSRRFRLPIAAYHELARKYGFEYLDEAVDNTSSKTAWRCTNSHIFTASYNQVSRGRGCVTCSGLTPKTANDYAAVARERGFLWIGELPKSIRKETLWECQHGHQWKQTYSNICHSHSGCPHCVNMVNGKLVSKLQVELHARTGGILNHTVGRYCIDIALLIGDIRIAIEYDAQHWHDADKDAKRDAFLISQGWRILRVKSGRFLPSQDRLDTALQQVLEGVQYAEIILSDWKDYAVLNRVP